MVSPPDPDEVAGIEEAPPRAVKDSEGSSATAVIVDGPEGVAPRAVIVEDPVPVRLRQQQS